jgi:hypothetical protein
MNVGKLISVSRVKEDSIRAASKNCRHSAIVMMGSDTEVALRLCV